MAVVFLATCGNLLLAADPSIQDFYFDWKYGEKDGACILIQKTDKETLAYLYPYGINKTQKFDLRSALLNVDDCDEIQKLLVQTVESSKLPRKTAEKNEIQFLKSKSYEVKFNRAEAKPRFLLYQVLPKRNLSVYLEMPMLEHYVKVLPGVPAAVKLVDERIGAAVK